MPCTGHPKHQGRTIAHANDASLRKLPHQRQDLCATQTQSMRRVPSKLQRHHDKNDHHSQGLARCASSPNDPDAAPAAPEVQPQKTPQTQHQRRTNPAAMCTVSQHTNKTYQHARWSILCILPQWSDRQKPVQHMSPSTTKWSTSNTVYKHHATYIKNNQSNPNDA